MLDSDIRTNPFPGLRSFEQDEEYLFFGREKQIDELLKKLRTTRFLSVIGSSGSGKSSLVKSGLLPSLYSGYMTTAGSSWRVALFRPGNDPIGNLAQVLSESGILYDHDGEDTMYTSIIEATLRRSRLGLFEAVRQSNLTKGDNLLVIVDQFEEIFRYSKYEEKVHGEKVTSQAFINLLLNAIKHEEANIYVGLTMRSDFLGECTQFRNLPEAINEGQYLIPRMTRDDIKQAISGPIAVGGGEITPRLLTRLLNDVGDSPDQLPILQHALMRTWDYWEQNHKADEPLDLIHYEAIGTMSKALSLHAEEALSDLPSEYHVSLAENLFKSLTDHGGKGQGIRRPTMLKEICELSNAKIEDVKIVIESFRKIGRSLLMPPVGVPLEESTIIDISHESLMRVWTRLKKWDEEENAASETYLRIAENAALYQEGKMGLLRGPELELALKWKEENNPNEKWARRYNPSFERAIIFLEHSRKQNEFEIEQKEVEQKKRLTRARRAIILFAIVAVIFLIMMLNAILLKSKAEAAEKEATRNEEKAMEATKIAKAEEKKALEAQEWALKEKVKAEEQEEIAKRQTKKAKYEAEQAEIARNAAVASERVAQFQTKKAQSESERANRNAELAQKATDKAKLNESIAKENADEAIREKNRAERLHDLEKSRSESSSAIQDINEGEFAKGAEKAINAYKLNVENNGPLQNSDNYRALRMAFEALEPNNLSLNSHNRSVRAIGLNSVNGMIATGDDGGTIFISKFKDGVLSEEQKINSKGPIRELTFSTSGKYLLGGTFNNYVTVWDANKLNSANDNVIADKLYPHIIKALTCVNVSGDDYAIVSTGHYITIEKITINGLVEVGRLPVDKVDAIKVSDDQRTVLLGSGDNLYEYKINDSPILSNPKITKLQAPIISLAISESNEFVAAGLLNGKIYIYDNDKAEGYHFTEHYSRVSSLGFKNYEDRVQLTSTGLDQTIKLIDVKHLLYKDRDPEEDKITIKGHNQWIHGGLYSPDKQYYLTIGEDQKIKTWYTSTKDLADAIEQILDKRKK